MVRAHVCRPDEAGSGDRSHGYSTTAARVAPSGDTAAAPASSRQPVHPHVLFFSYSRGNLVAVRAVAAELRRLGYRTWLDLENLRPGERWREAIDRALASCEAMVFCISRLSIDSAWTGVELQAALDRRVPVVPLMVERVPVESLPPRLQELHFVDVAARPALDVPRLAAEAIASRIGRPTATDDLQASPAEALQVRLSLDGAGRMNVGWTSRLWSAANAPLAPGALAELARAAEEIGAAEVHVAPEVPAERVALVLGALATRLGAGRLLVHGPRTASGGLQDLAVALGAGFVLSALR